jgi:hypothetical protein
MRGEVDGTLTDFAIFGGVGSDVETVFGGLEWEGAVVEMSDYRVHVNIWESRPNAKCGGKTGTAMTEVAPYSEAH